MDRATEKGVAGVPTSGHGDIAARALPTSRRSVAGSLCPSAEVRRQASPPVPQSLRIDLLRVEIRVALFDEFFVLLVIRV